MFKPGEPSNKQKIYVKMSIGFWSLWFHFKANRNNIGSFKNGASLRVALRAGDMYFRGFRAVQRWNAHKQHANLYFLGFENAPPPQIKKKINVPITEVILFILFHSHSVFTCSKLTIETSKQGVK